jgi:hypothetical protein
LASDIQCLSKFIEFLLGGALSATDDYQMQTGKQGNNVYRDSNELSRMRGSEDPTSFAIWEVVYPKEHGDRINNNARFRGKATTFVVDRLVEHTAWDFR